MNLELNSEHAIPVKDEAFSLNLKMENSSSSTLKGGVCLISLNGDTLLEREVGDFQTEEKIEIEVPLTLRKTGMYEIKASFKDADGMIVESVSSIPVVAKKMWLGWCDGTGEYGRRLLTDYNLRWFNFLTQVKKREDIKYWKSRGVALFAERGALVRVLSDEGVSDYWGDSVVEEGGYEGVAIDEFNIDYFGEKDKEVFKYVKEFESWKNAHADFKVLAWHCGPLMSQHAKAYQTFADIILLEGYTNYFRGAFKTRSDYRYLDQRINMARDMDIIDKSIMALCVTVAHGGVAKENLEAQVRYVKQNAPEMPGLAFYSGRPTEPALKIFADTLFLRYYIMPVITFWPEKDIQLSNYQTTINKPVTIRTIIHNIGGMDSDEVEVKYYSEKVSNGQRELIGERIIESVPAGVVHKTIDAGSLVEPWVNFGGNNDNWALRRSGSIFTNPILPAVEEAEILWTPRVSGVHRIIVELIASGQTESLTCVGTKNIVVK